MLKFKECDDGKPIVIKKEYSDAEYVDVNITNSPKSEEIPSIKCEEIDIKEELDDVAEISKPAHKDDYDSFENDASSSRKINIRKSDSAGKRHFCPKCPYSSNRSYDIKRHMRSHSDNEEHKCSLCTFITDNRLSFKTHMTSHKGRTKEFGCHRCPYETDHKHNLAYHALKHKDMLEVEMYKCEECSFSTKYKYNLVGHQLVHADPKVVNKFKCEKCPYRGKRQHVFRRHMKIHSEELQYRAGINESDHEKDYDSFENDASSYRKRNIRKNDSEDDRLSLKPHLTSHKGPTKEFGCHKCPYETDLKHSLAQHSLEHKDMLEVETYKCPLCPYVSKYKPVMQTHQKLQHDEKIKMYKCEECPFSTKYKDNLVGHQLTHADPKVVNKFKCEKCSYQGKRQSDLKRHSERLTHSEKLWYSDSPLYKCKLCSYQAKTTSYIKAHMTKYHPDPSIAPRKCAHCPYETTARQLLIRHIKRQHKRQRSADVEVCVVPLHHHEEETNAKPLVCPPISHISV